MHTLELIHGIALGIATFVGLPLLVIFEYRSARRRHRRYLKDPHRLPPAGVGGADEGLGYSASDFGGDSGGGGGGGGGD